MVGRFQDILQQGRLATSQKARNDGDWNGFILLPGRLLLQRDILFAIILNALRNYRFLYQVSKLLCQYAKIWRGGTIRNEINTCHES